MKRVVIIALALAVAGGALWVFLGRKAAPADAGRQPETVTVQVRTIEQFVNTNGTVQPSQLSEVRSEVSGRVVKVFVQEGDAVTPNQPLLELDQNQLRSDITAAELQIESARVRAEQLTADLRRNEQLSKERLIPEKEMTDTKAEAARAEIERKILQARLDRLRTELAKTTIVAPIAGTVLNLAAREGIVITGASSVSEGTVLMQIANLERLEVEAKASEIDVARLEAGLPAKVTFDSAPGTVADGRLEFVAPSAGSGVAPARGSGRGSESAATASKDFRMIASLGEVTKQVKPGMSANLKIQVGTARDVPSLEISAIFVDDDGSFVFVKRGGKFQRQKVETGFTDLRFVEIRSGLANGDVISLERPADEPKKDGNK